MYYTHNLLLQTASLNAVIINNNVRLMARKNIHICKFSIIPTHFKVKILLEESFSRRFPYVILSRNLLQGLRSNINTCVNFAQLTATRLFISFPNTIHFSQECAVPCVRSWHKFSKPPCEYLYLLTDTLKPSAG